MTLGYRYLKNYKYSYNINYDSNSLIENGSSKSYSSDYLND